MMSPRTGRLQPLQAVHHGIGQRLAGVGIFLDEVERRKQAGRRHRAAKHVHRALERAGVADDPAPRPFAPAWSSPGRCCSWHRSGRNAARPVRRQRPCPRRQSSRRRPSGRPCDSTRLATMVLDESRRRTRRSSCPCRSAIDLVAGHGFGGHAQGDLRRPALQHKRLEHLALALQVDGVLVGAARPHRPRRRATRLQRLRAARQNR